MALHAAVLSSRVTCAEIMFKVGCLDHLLVVQIIDLIIQLKRSVAAEFEVDSLIANLADEHGQTAPHAAAVAGSCVPAIDLLAAHGANLMAVDSFGQTARQTLE